MHAKGRGREGEVVASGRHGASGLMNLTATKDGGKGRVDDDDRSRGGLLQPRPAWRSWIRW
jgi:hypothetical protein